MIKAYIDYLKDNPEGLWFKRKIFGWGWTPARWQGWLVLFTYVLLVVFFALAFDERSSKSEMMFTFFMPIFFLTATLIRICYKKGEKPKWQWGIPSKKVNV